MEFLAPLKNAWDVHTFSFTNPEKTFIVLAESRTGPMIIEFPNIICTLFDINSKYPSTLIPIKNFVLHTLKQIKSSTISQLKSIVSPLQKFNDNTLDDILKKHHKKPVHKTLELMNERA